MGIRPIAGKQVCDQPVGSGGGKHPHQQQRHQWAGNVQQVCEAGKIVGEQVQEAGGPQHTDGGQEPHQRGGNFRHGFQPFFGPLDKIIVDRTALGKPVGHNVKDDQGQDQIRKIKQNLHGVWPGKKPVPPVGVCFSKNICAYLQRFLIS